MGKRRRPLEGGTIKVDFLRRNFLDQQAELRRRMAAIESEAVTHEAAENRFQIKGRDREFDGWGQDDVAASQSAVILDRWGLSSEQAKGFSRDGSVTHLEIWLTETRTVGQLDVEVYIAGVASGLIATIDAENTQFAEAMAAVGEYPFTAGEAITLRVTTDASWLPVTADLRVCIQVATD